MSRHQPTCVKDERLKHFSLTLVLHRLQFSPSPDSDKDSGAPIADAHCAAGAFLDEAELSILEKKASLLDQLLPPSSFPSSSSASSSSAYLTRLEKDVARVAEELRSASSAQDKLGNCKCGAAEGEISRVIKLGAYTLTVCQ